MAAISPSGSRVNHPWRFSEPANESNGTTSPTLRRVSAAESCSVFTARETSLRAWRMVFPASADDQFGNLVAPLLQQASGSVQDGARS